MENPTLRRRSSYLSIDRPVKMIGRKRAYCPAPKFLPVSSISSPSRRMRARHNRQKFVQNFSSRSLYSPWSNITAQGRTTRNCSNLPPNVHKTGKCSLVALLRIYKTFIFRSKMTFSCICALWIRTLNFLHDISAPSLYNLDESAQSRNILNFNTSHWISMASTYLHKIQNDGKPTYIKIVLPWARGIPVNQKVPRVRIAVHVSVTKYHFRKNVHQQGSDLITITLLVTVEWSRYKNSIYRAHTLTNRM